MTRRSILPAILFLVTAACGSKPFMVEAKYPTEPTSLEPDTGVTVLVKDVTDNRQWEVQAESLSVHGLWGVEPEGVERTQVIGAKSGKEIDNIYLKGDKTVEDIVRSMVRVAFHQAGYRVLKDEETEADLVAEVSIDRFWLWMTPGGMTIRVESVIDTSVTVTGKQGSAEFSTMGSHDSRDVTRAPDSYTFALQEALYDYYAHLSTQCITMELESPAEEQ